MTEPSRKEAEVGHSSRDHTLMWRQVDVGRCGLEHMEDETDELCKAS